MAVHAVQRRHSNSGTLIRRDTPHTCAASIPAKVVIVTAQSETWKMPLYHCPRARGGTRGPAMNAGERMPPSQLLNLPPQNGKLDPESATLPPLSLTNTNSVLHHMPVCWSASVMLATASSSAVVMDINFLRAAHALWLPTVRPFRPIWSPVAGHRCVGA